MHSNSLILFDIDRTLIIMSSGYTEAFLDGFRRVYGIEADLNIINCHGMTDQGVIIEILKKNGLTEGEIKAKIGDCMKVIVQSFQKIVKKGNFKPPEDFKLLEGVEKLLKELSQRNILMGLVTGNLEEIARGKMRLLGLDRYFKVGGFGSDDIKRADLVRLAIKRAEKGFNFKPDDNIFLFGDTPQDIEAAKEAGIKAIGVTTGIYSKEDLSRCKPDYILEDLTDIDKILNLLDLI